MPSSHEPGKRRRASLVGALVLALAVGSCSSKDATSQAPPPTPAATVQSEAHARGLANGTAMIDNAKLCEPQTGTPSLAACQRACELNHSNSCANWGALLENRAPESALPLYQRACKGGSGIGCEGLARLTAKAGNNAEAFFLNARRYHRIHCSQGYARSCEQLAGLFEAGLGGPVTPAAAKTFRMQACSLGRNASCSR